MTHTTAEIIEMHRVGFISDSERTEMLASVPTQYDTSWVDAMGSDCLPVGENTTPDSISIK